MNRRLNINAPAPSWTADDPAIKWRGARDDYNKPVEGVKMDDRLGEGNLLEDDGVILVAQRHGGGGVGGGRGGGDGGRGGGGGDGSREGDGGGG